MYRRNGKGMQGSERSVIENETGSEKSVTGSVRKRVKECSRAARHKKCALSRDRGEGSEREGELAIFQRDIINKMRPVMEEGR